MPPRDSGAVTSILDAVRQRGDAALRELTEQFDHARIESFRVSDAELEAAVHDTPVDVREALELAYFSGLTQVEIADRTGAPLGTVKGRVRLALVALRRALEASGNDGPGGAP